MDLKRIEKRFKRTKISDIQKHILNKYYSEQKFPSNELIKKISIELNLTNRNIKIWFQNRRQRENINSNDINESKIKSLNSKQNKIKKDYFLEKHFLIGVIAPKYEEVSYNLDDFWIIPLRFIEKNKKENNYYHIAVLKCNYFNNFNEDNIILYKLLEDFLDQYFSNDEFYSLFNDFINYWPIELDLITELNEKYIKKPFFDIF